MYVRVYTDMWIFKCNTVGVTCILHLNLFDVFRDLHKTQINEINAERYLNHSRPPPR